MAGDGHAGDLMAEALRRTQMPTALIAEDEPLLAHALGQALAREWPELDVVATVGHGRHVVSESLRLLPDILFVDLRMPVLDGIAAAEQLADRWPCHKAMPELVFVIAHDDPVARSLARAGIDHLLKPRRPEQFGPVITRLRKSVGQRTSTGLQMPIDVKSVPDPTLLRWRHMLETASQMGAAPPLQFLLTADSHGSGPCIVPIDDVIYFEAADRHVRVVTMDMEHIIPTSLRQIQEQIDPAVFCRVHHSVIVRSGHIDRLSPDETGRLQLQLHTRPERIVVSRLYASRLLGS